MWKRRFWKHPQSSKLLGQFQKGQRFLLQRKEVRQSREGACGREGGCAHPNSAARPQTLRQPNPHTAGSPGFPAKFALTLRDTKHSRVLTGEAVTAVPFNRVYDFPGASQPGDARERARKRKCLGDVNAVKTLAGGMRSSCPGKWRVWGVGPSQSQADREKERVPSPGLSPSQRVPGSRGP